MQAADAVVYEIRRALNCQTKHPELSGGLRKQFDRLASGHGMAYVANSNGEQLEWLVNNHKAGDPFKLDEIMKNQIEENIDKLRT